MRKLLKKLTTTNVKYIVVLLLISIPYSTVSQNDTKQYLAQYGIEKETINELSFKNEKHFRSFITVFEDKQGFELPKFLIIDESGKLLKHKLDVYIKECGKGDVNELRKKYFKKQPALDSLNEYFNEELKVPEKDHFIVIFIWIKETDSYNKHTFETYNTWKDNDNIEFYFLNLKYG